MDFKTEVIPFKVPEGCNIIVGRSHFIETVENVYEAMVHSVPNIKFGLAFVEASGKCLVRHAGNDEELEKLASELALKVGAGHTFYLIIKNAYPINVMHALKAVPEVVGLYCATANPIEIIVAETEQGRAILAVIDGFKPKGVESKEDAKERKEFLRKIGYKL
ncbi:MAG: adenosine monophosphate-protein transferase [Candidatus Methanomethylicota archaeon]|uniref:Adenosine monophosphate-protein transferase n=1 Tax=Thermoproteota archaeon TaxID=2056631 RepID=A0A497EV26_9CREN|nr:MAG: adenosine monophosphate-protein transferase [Candidatus Verstraetearchaeota archaeon]